MPFHSEDMAKAKAAAPKWVQTTIPVEVKDNKKGRVWQLTYSNLVYQAVIHHWQDNMNLNVSLQHVVHHMMENTRWRPPHISYTRGVPECYYKAGMWFSRPFSGLPH